MKLLPVIGATLLAPWVLLQVIVYTVACCLPIYGLIVLKVLSPRWEWRRSLTEVMLRITELWGLGTVRLFDFWLPTQWEIDLPEGLDRNGSYLVIANHQSWVDIIVVLKCLLGHIPYPRFFLKRQLLWMPFMGPVFWGLDYPAMRRHSREYLEKHPEKRGEDLETVRRSMRRYRGRPVIILNFLEGTRFRPQKHAEQNSPYRHLLKPRTGGVAFAVNAMEGDLKELIDLTIAYPHGIPGFLPFLGGRVPLIRAKLRVEPISADLVGGDYEGDPEYRRRCQEIVQALWERKDQDLDEMLKTST